MQLTEVTARKEGCTINASIIDSRELKQSPGVGS